MPKIVGIHGISHQYEGSAILNAQWLPALHGGLSAAGCRTLADELTSRDLNVAFFGDLFRPPGALSAGDVPYSARGLTLPAEIDLLTDLYNAAVALEPGLGPPHGSLGPVRVSAQHMAERLLRSRTFADRIPERLFVGNLKQVVSFLSDSNVKSRVLDRVDAEVDTDTRVLIGHSLGSVVAYEYLCRQPIPGVVLITLGSPLGIRNVIFDKLNPPPTAGIGVWPGVRRWTNVADPNDIVALRNDLAPIFAPPREIPGIADVLVDNGSHTHSAERYLTARETGAAIATGLQGS
jgi:hypothetical protein